MHTSVNLVPAPESHAYSTSSSTLHQLVDILWTRIVGDNHRIVKERSAVANGAEPMIATGSFFVSHRLIVYEVVYKDQ